jgi:hypothetical protein
MYISGLVDTLVIHANTNGVWPNFLFWSPPWLYASSVKNKTNRVAKEQIKPKADWHAIDSPKKRTNEFVSFAMIVRKYLKLEIETSSFKYFRTVKQKKKIGSFGFWKNLWRANLLTVLSDL